MSSDPNAERDVKKLARFDGNTTCANCGVRNAKFGFSTVCIKFHTFVCNDCKSSHQAVSHRCKSLTMSSWSAAEVDELRRKGNDHARRTWLAHAPPVGQNGRPAAGASLATYKRFVVDAYEHRRYYAEHAAAAPAAEAPPVDKPRRKKSAAPRTVAAAPPVVRRPVSPPAPPPVVDLLSFGFDDPPAAPVPATLATTASSSQPPVAFDLFAAPPSARPTPTDAPVVTTKAVFDPFADNNNTPTTAFTPPTNPMNNCSSVPCDVATESPAPSSVPTKTPVMNSMAAPNALSHAFSQQQQQQQQQMFLLQQQRMMMMMQQQQQGGNNNNNMTNGGMNMTYQQQQQQQQQMNPMMMTMMYQQQQQQRAMSAMNNQTLGSSVMGTNVNVPQTYSSSAPNNDPFAGLKF